LWGGGGGFVIGSVLAAEPKGTQTHVNDPKRTLVGTLNDDREVQGTSDIRNFSAMLTRTRGLELKMKKHYPQPTARIRLLKSTGEGVS